MTKTRVTDAMADQAIEWFARLRADDVTVDDRAGFIAWLRDDRNHQLAFVEIMNLWDDMAAVKTLDFAELRLFDVLWQKTRQSDPAEAQAEVSCTPVYSLGPVPA